MIWDLLSLTGDLALLMWLAAAVFWALAGGALASWLGRSMWRGAALGAALPVVGAVVQLVRAAIRGNGAGGFRRARPLSGWPGFAARVGAVALAALAAVALVVVTGLADTHLGAGSARLDLTVRNLGLATVTVVTVVVLVAAAVLSWRRPSRGAAVAVAWCASWWLLWALAAMLVGDTLRVLVDSTGLAESVDAEVTVGLSWTLVLVLAGALLAWSAAMIVVADRPPVGGSAAAPWPGAWDAAAGLPVPRPAGDPFAGTGNSYGAPADPFAAASPPPPPPSAGWADPFSGGR